MLDFLRPKSRALTVREEPVPPTLSPPANGVRGAQELTSEEFAQIFGGAPAFGSIQVNTSTAMQVSAVFACVGLISRTIAALPWKVFTKDANGFDVEAREHPYWNLLANAPNGYQTSSVYREQLFNRMLLHGQGYSQLSINGAGRVVSIDPRAGYEVSVDFDGKKKNFAVDEPGPSGATLQVPASRMIDVPYFVLDTDRAVDTLSQAARNAIGLARMLEEFQGRQVGQGAHPGGIIKQTSGEMTAEGVKNMLRSFNRNQGGVANAGKWFYLDADKEATSFEVKNRDNQTIETRRNSVIEIARYYGVPPHMIGAMETTSSWGTGVEQQMLGFMKFTLRPLIVKLEQEFNAKLFAGSPYFNELSTEALLRGDAASQEAFITGMVTKGIWMPNEGRKVTGRPPHPEGDVLYQPSGTQVLGAEPDPEPENTPAEPALEEESA